MSTKTTVYLIRHGDTLQNAAAPGPEIERGWSSIGIDERGRREALRVAKRASELGITAIVASDLPRAKQTAKIITDELGIKPEFTPQLRSWNLGYLTGKPCTTVRPIERRLVMMAQDRAPAGGESLEAFTRRTFAALADGIANHPKDVLGFVLHSKALRIIRAWDACGQPADHSLDLDVFMKHFGEPGGCESWRVNADALKLPQDQAGFKRGGVRYSEDRCGGCKAFRGRDKCTKVVGPLDADDWCLVGMAKSDGHTFDRAFPRKKSA